MNGWLTVLRKDVREMWRDRRVMIGVFVMPMFMMIVFVSMFGVIEKKLGKEPDIKIGILGSPADPFAQKLQAGTKPKASLAYFRDQAQADAALEKGEVKVVVVPPADWAAALASGRAGVGLRFDHQSPINMVAASIVRKKIDEENERLTQEALAKAGISQPARPIVVSESDSSKAKGLGASSVSGLLPYLIVLFAFTAAASSAADLVAGEKERGTMETLLVSPPSRVALALGKFGSLSLVSLLGGTVAVVSLTLVGALKIPGSEAIFPKGVAISPEALLLLVGLLVPLSMMYAGIMVAVSAAARSMREAQSYLAVLNLVVLAPAIASQVVGVTGMDKSPAIAWIPVLNTAIGIKNALGGQADFRIFVGALLTSVCVASVAVAIAFALFRREAFLRRV